MASEPSTTDAKSAAGDTSPRWHNVAGCLVIVLTLIGLYAMGFIFFVLPYRGVDPVLKVPAYEFEPTPTDSALYYAYYPVMTWDVGDRIRFRDNSRPSIHGR